MIVKKILLTIIKKILKKNSLYLLNNFDFVIIFVNIVIKFYKMKKNCLPKTTFRKSRSCKKFNKLEEAGQSTTLINYRC